MSKLTEYTIEVYKCDRRVKGSYRLIEKKDFAPVTKDYKRPHHDYTAFS